MNVYNNIVRIQYGWIPPYINIKYGWIKMYIIHIVKAKCTCT